MPARMAGDAALVENDVRLGVDARCEKSSRDLANVVFELLRLLPDRNGMQIDDTIQTLVAFLQRHDLVIAPR